MNKLTQSLTALTAATALGVVGLQYVSADDHATEEKTEEVAEKETESQESTEQAAEKEPIPEDMTWIGQVPDDRRSALEALIGQPAPELSLSDGYNGEPLTNDDFEGKITIVDVWATWCPPCIAAIPKNNELAEKYADDGVVVLGVTTSSGQEKLGEMVKKHDIEYPVFTDPDKATMEAWATPFFPSYYVVDRDGIVRGVVLDPNKIEDVIKMLLEEDKDDA